MMPFSCLPCIDTINTDSKQRNKQFQLLPKLKFNNVKGDKKRYDCRSGFFKTFLQKFKDSVLKINTWFYLVLVNPE
jgi:hypothetical protein